jgi:hypothetical protein
MPIQKYSFTQALQALGVAEIFTGDAFTADGMESLGAIEGAIREQITWRKNALTAPEHTGGLEHQATMVPESVQFVAPVILGDPDLIAKISPTGSGDGAEDSPTPVVTTSVLLIPRAEIPDAGISYDGTSYTPAGYTPQNWLFFPRAYLMHGEIPRPYDNGGKAIVDVTVTAMYYAAGPAGKRAWVRGDPVTAGYSTFRL